MDISILALQGAHAIQIFGHEELNNRMQINKEVSTEKKKSTVQSGNINN